MDSNPQGANQQTVVAPQNIITTQEQSKFKNFNPFSAGLRWYEYLICGLPFILIVSGGAIGAFIGFIAFSTNIKMWKSNQSLIPRLMKVFGITILAFAITLGLPILFKILLSSK